MKLRKVKADNIEVKHMKKSELNIPKILGSGKWVLKEITTEEDKKRVVEIYKAITQPSHTGIYSRL